MAINRITLCGYLGRDPEMGEYVTNDGKMGKKAKFSLAVPKRRPDETMWVNCIVFGTRAEVIEKYCRKGSRLFLEGYLNDYSYEQNGEKRKGYQVVIDEFILPEKRNDGPTPDFTDVSDVDIPF